MISVLDQNIAEKIKNSENCLIASHVRPDADAVGSLLGLGLALQQAGKHVQMVLQDGVGRFGYLPRVEEILKTPQGEFDLIIIVDCSDPDRVGDVLKNYRNPDIVVDHHKTNLQFGEYNVVEPDQVATAAILFDHMSYWGLAFNSEVATSLLAGIVGDTIGYRTPNVDSKVMRISGALMDLGADLSMIYQEELVTKPFTAVHYWGSGLNRLEHDDGIVWTSLRVADRERIGYAKNDDADLVNVLSSIKEAEIAIIFVEQSQNEVKISWRARPGYDVSGIAFEFGGGGHAAAAGADVERPLEEVKQEVLSETRKLLQKQRKNKE